jgi:hypothetical protein
MLFSISVAILLVLIAVPLLPGVIELARPRDNKELSVSATFVRDPRFFGKSFREKIEPILKNVPQQLPSEVKFLGRGSEQAVIDRSFLFPDGANTGQILIALEAISAGNNVQLLDAFASNDITAGNNLHARVIASNGTVTLGPGARVVRWLDALSTVNVGDGSELGKSASSTAQITLGHRCRFDRLFGFPVHTGSRQVQSIPKPHWKNARVIPAGKVISGDLICQEDLIVEEDARISGSIKCYGNLYVGGNVTIGGNLIGRSNILINKGVCVDGHVFSERSVRVAGTFRLGRLDLQKSIYAAKQIELGPDCSVYGWIVAEGGGVTA